MWERFTVYLGFDGSNIQVFMERFIDVSRLDMPAVISTAIEKYILETAPAADWFMEFSRRMITQTGWELGVHRSLRDDTVLLWNNPEMASFIGLIVTYYLSGAKHVIVPGWRRGMTLVNCGLQLSLRAVMEENILHQ
ncbi:hypothetical protein SELMODRAFT_405550 [Selaginella moellendorffii]|uniref:Uncharacterized protein n=1 Tax=Selaginella moellendorffii TaxID=88036 RepID=D8QYY3_SELML|nr:hypothetical protein SELMODRAFT_405550 [Selaginella moellendorffii]